MENKNYSTADIPIGMGGSIIVVILVVLCLTVFSVLSFDTAYSDLKLTEKTEEMAADYYKINGKAEEKLSDIYNAMDSICKSMKDTDTPETFYSDVFLQLAKIDDVSIIGSNDGSFKIYYESLGDKNQKICVTLDIFYDELKHCPSYEIETWNLSAIEFPDYEQQNIDLWEGLE